MKKHLLHLTLGFALLGAAMTATAQNTLSDVFLNGGFTNPMSETNTIIGTMTLTYSGAPLTLNTRTLLADIPDYQFNISITDPGNSLHTFDNISLAAGSTLAGIEVIALASGGFLFFNTSSEPANSYRGSADFVNEDAYLTTAPPSFFTGYPNAIADGFSFYVLQTANGSVMGNYGSGIAVPEPGTLVLAAVGGASLLFLRRRK